jgi:uncharacterized membrane protein
MAQATTLERARLGPLTLPRFGSTERALVAVSGIVAVYFAVCSLLIHYSFHSHGWDLGLFDQVIWSLSEGRGWEYSAREMSYLGDHFSPILLLLVPLAWLDAGPAPLLVAQAVALSAATVPLFAATRRVVDERAAWFVVGAYLLSLAVARTVNYDFHPEAFIPLFGFTAFWALTARRPAVFVAACLVLLTVKEDAALVVLAMCWLAAFAFSQWRLALGVGAFAVVYSAVVSLVVMPHYLGDATNPMVERYGYLGDSTGEILVSLVTRPDLVLEQLARWEALKAALLVLAGVAFLPLARPVLLLPLVALVVAPLLAVHDLQSILEIHYGIAPMTYAFCCALVALPIVAKWLDRRVEQPLRIPVAAAPLVAAAVIFLIASPLPPSFGTHFDRYYPDGHSSVARDFVDDIPDDARVSAQATFVPHLSRRQDIYEFPRVVNAEYVILDDERRIPYYAAPGFGECEGELPGLGFRLIREEDGIRLYERTVTESPGDDSACD